MRVVMEVRDEDVLRVRTGPVVVTTLTEDEKTEYTFFARIVEVQGVK